MSSIVIAIDPGAIGGIAWSEDGKVSAVPMPAGMSEQVEFLRKLGAGVPGENLWVFIEDTGTYRPGNSGPAACTFARHCGHLECMLYCLVMPAVKVRPQLWMKSIGTMPKDKTERKNKIKEFVARAYPHLRVTLKTADALAILWYAVNSSRLKPGACP